jgi:ribosome biogenesis protein Nip4
MEYAVLVRKINEIESKIIIETLSKISKKGSAFFDEHQFNFYVIISKERNRVLFPKIFFVPKNIVSLYKKLSFKSKITSIGLYFGFIKQGALFISLEGVEFLDKKDLLTEKNKIRVNKKGEKAILYGNDILKTMLELPNRDSMPIINAEDIVIFTNKFKEILAIGFMTGNTSEFENLSSKSLIAQNLIDKGYYLREIQ